ncbi:TIGR04372 family glycosyltransferase [Pelagibacteraceae bacterium]|nr:TIGR04372 family glycosyltransferase [Pelagibacteraceae bacterium]
MNFNNFTKKTLSFIYSEPKLLILLPIGLIIIILLLIIFPIKKIRIGFLNTSRIGHFTENTENYFLIKKYIDKKNQNSLDLFYCTREISNDFLRDLWARKIYILPYNLLRMSCLIVRVVKPLNFLSCTLNLNPRDIHNLYDKSEPTLSLTQAEEYRGAKELEKLGLKANEKFVCLIVRDNFYLKSIYNDNSFIDSHNFRNCEIENFVLMAEYLNKLGYYVIRMGVKANKKFPITNSKIIDYAFNGSRSDFMDIYLGSKCEFCISTGTGFDGIPSIFRKPILYTNILPFGAVRTSSSKNIFITKHLIDKSSNKKLSILDMINCKIINSTKANDYKNFNILILENTPSEIKDAVEEMLLRIKGDFFYNNNEKELHAKFWKLFPDDLKHNNFPLHGAIRGNIGNSFLKENQHLLKG